MRELKISFVSNMFSSFFQDTEPSCSSTGATTSVLNDPKSGMDQNSEEVNYICQHTSYSIYTSYLIQTSIHTYILILVISLWMTVCNQSFCQSFSFNNNILRWIVRWWFRCSTVIIALFTLYLIYLSLIVWILSTLYCLFKHLEVSMMSIESDADVHIALMENSSTEDDVSFFLIHIYLTLMSHIMHHTFHF